MASLGLLLVYVLAVSAMATPLVNANGLVSPQRPLVLPSKSHYRCFASSLEAAEYPQPNGWLPFETLWAINQPAILSRNGGDTYIEHYLREAIEQSSLKHKIDPRLVLVAVLQVVRSENQRPYPHINTPLTRPSVPPVRRQSQRRLLRPLADQVQPKV